MVAQDENQAVKIVEDSPTFSSYGKDTYKSDGHRFFLSKEDPNIERSSCNQWLLYYVVDVPDSEEAGVKFENWNFLSKE